jgi:hypothetical protein
MAEFVALNQEHYTQSVMRNSGRPEFVMAG